MPPPPTPPPSPDLLFALLHTAVHQILWTRQLYDPVLFESRGWLGIQVHHHRHPDVQSYVLESLTQLWPGIVRGTIPRVAVLVRDSNGDVFERHVFEMSLGDVGDPSSSSRPSHPTWEQSVRRVLVRLLQRLSQRVGDEIETNTTTAPWECGRTFELVAFVPGEVGGEVGDVLRPEAWVEVDTVLESVEVPEATLQPGTAQSMRVPGVFVLQLYSERRGLGAGRG